MHIAIERIKEILYDINPIECSSKISMREMLITATNFNVSISWIKNTSIRISFEWDRYKHDLHSHHVVWYLSMDEYVGAKNRIVLIEKYENKSRFKNITPPEIEQL